VLADEADRLLVDEAGAGLLRVVDVQLDAVVVAEHADDAALGPGVAASSKARLASTMTGRRSARWRATVRPARPAPT